MEHFYLLPTNHKQKKLAIIGASYLQEPLVRKAKEMGLYTICFSWNKGAVCETICDKFYPISIIEKDNILKECIAEQIDGICTIASDTAAPTVSYIAEKMHLVANSYSSSILANNKFLMRNVFVKNNIPCPKYKLVSSVEELENIEWNFPLIVKPTDRSGSLGVTKCLSYEELTLSIEKAISLSFEKKTIVEEFIEGSEISVEFISYKGIHYPLQITDKITTGPPHFVELEHHQPSELSDDMYAKIYDITTKALDALGLDNGASHAEYKITSDGQIVIMELGGRMGGDFIGSNLVFLSTGYDFLKGVIEVALDNFNKPQKTIYKYSGIYFLCKETERIMPIIGDWKNNPAFILGSITDNELRQATCSADRSGFVIYQSDKKEKI